MEIIRNMQGDKIGEIRSTGLGQEIYDRYGRRLGYFDGSFTYDSFGRRIGSGNQLMSLLNRF